jgi:hypothetical protein
MVPTTTITRTTTTTHEAKEAPRGMRGLRFAAGTSAHSLWSGAPVSSSVFRPLRTSFQPPPAPSASC